MSYRSDDLTPLLAPQAAPGMGFRQGTILTWNQATAENTVDVGGATLTNVPILNTNEALLLATGDVVALMTAGPSWFILGRVTVPGTPQAATALDAASNGIVAATITTQQSTSSTTYGDLATVGPAVTARIRSTGKCLVIVSSQMGSAYSAVTAIGAATSFVASGANTLATSGARSINWYSATGGATSMTRVDQFGATFYLSGLNPGNTTFTLKYRSQVAGLNADFSDRVLVVMPL